MTQRFVNIKNVNLIQTGIHKKDESKSNTSKAKEVKLSTRKPFEYMIHGLLFKDDSGNKGKLFFRNIEEIRFEKTDVKLWNITSSFKAKVMQLGVSLFLIPFIFILLTDNINFILWSVFGLVIAVFACLLYFLSYISPRQYELNFSLNSNKNLTFYNRNSIGKSKIIILQKEFLDWQKIQGLDPEPNGIYGKDGSPLYPSNIPVSDPIVKQEISDLKEYVKGTLEDVKRTFLDNVSSLVKELIQKNKIDYKQEISDLKKDVKIISSDNIIPLLKRHIQTSQVNAQDISSIKSNILSLNKAIADLENMVSSDAKLGGKVGTSKGEILATIDEIKYALERGGIPDDGWVDTFKNLRRRIRKMRIP
ncbi:MAG: hypothetical protein SWJ54_15245 [Cyanobacteriota bacterium]|nr:hypothetical protein [Cyanobacteriota bacterium]